MQGIKVQKRDGNLENWNEDKLINSIAKTGVSMETSEKVAGQVSSWVKSNAASGTITSNAIRDIVTKFLSVEDIAAASTYETYSKTA